MAALSLLLILILILLYSGFSVLEEGADAPSPTPLAECELRFRRPAASVRAVSGLCIHRCGSAARPVGGGR